MTNVVNFDITATEKEEVDMSKLSEKEWLCRYLLGKDYITPEELARIYSWSYSDSQLERLAETLPGEDVIHWLRANNYMLIATPPTDLNLLQVRDINNLLFYKKTKDWYENKKQKFSRSDVIRAGEWLMICKEPFPKSKNKIWNEQKVLLSDDELVPNVPELVYAVTAYCELHHIYLLEDMYVRTASVDVDGNHVIVGCFNIDGLTVNFHWDEDSSSTIGILSARS